MKILAVLAASSWIVTAQAQGVPPSTGTPPPPPAASSGQGPATPATQPPQRGNIAPILDIRIQDEGIRLPKSRDDTPPPEKPPAK